MSIYSLNIVSYKAEVSIVLLYIYTLITLLTTGLRRPNYYITIFLATRVCDDLLYVVSSLFMAFADRGL